MKAGHCKGNSIIMLAAISLIVFANTLGNDYALDDFTVIKNNTIVTKGISAIPQIFTTPYRRGWFVSDNDFYRPLSLAMFAVEYQLSGGSPTAGHMVNILLFAGCVILLFLFLMSYLIEKERSLSLLLLCYLPSIRSIRR
jgi:hypothetical protein